MKRAIVAALLIVGCVKVDTSNQQLPSGPSIVTSSPSPSASASPTAGPPPPVATVRVSEFAREGGNGPCGEGTTLRVGCSAFVTCTPRDSGGVDVGARYVPEWNSAGAVVVTPTTLNVYNAKVQCDHGGTGIVACSVGGVLGSTQYDCVE